MVPSCAAGNICLYSFTKPMCAVVVDVDGDVIVVVAVVVGNRDTNARWQKH